METLWFLLGVALGLIVAWSSLSNRYRSHLAEKDAELVTAGQQADQEIARERRAHDATRSRLSGVEKTEASTPGQLARLQSELAAARSETDLLKTKHADMVAQLRRAVSEKSELESRFSTADRERTELAGQLEALRNAGTRDREASRSQASELKKHIDGQEQEILRLRATLDETGSAPTGNAKTAARRREGDQVPAELVPQSDLFPEDLTQIKGIGRVLNGKLRQLGITKVQQIADFTQSDIARINAILDFPGRIEREGWVEQAKAIVGRVKSN